MTYHFPKKILGSCISLTYNKRLVKSYDELRKFRKSGPLAFFVQYLNQLEMLTVTGKIDDHCLLVYIQQRWSCSLYIFSW